MTLPANNTFAETVKEVETLTKPKARKLALSLSENIEANYFKLGGVLNVINTNKWFDGYKSFQDYVFEKFGFRLSKAMYLINSYVTLVDKMIPYDKVQHLGWCKMRVLANTLTLENLDEWVAKAEKLSYSELCKVLKAKPEAGGEIKTTSEIVSLKFNLHKDQSEAVQQMLAKIKGEIHNDKDSVALYNASQLILNGSAKPVAVTNEQLKARLASAGWEAVLMAFGEMWPEIDLQVTLPEPKKLTQVCEA